MQEEKTLIYRRWRINMKCFVLAGGSGDALWPLSRKHYPKQFMHILEGRSLFQEAIARNLPFCDQFYIITNQKYEHIVKAQLQVFQKLNYTCILEEVGKQTAPAVYRACMEMTGDEEVLVVSTDHLVLKGDYNNTIIEAREELVRGEMVVVGCPIDANQVEGHGIFVHTDRTVIDFHEKVSSNFYTMRDYSIDSGIFLMHSDTYREALETYYKGFREIYLNTPKEIPTLSVGRAIFEPFARDGKLKVVIAKFKWSRVLDLEALSDYVKDSKEYQVIKKDCDQVTIINENKDQFIVANQLQDLIVVNTKDAMYLTKRGSSEAIRQVMKEEFSSYQRQFEEGDVFYASWGIKETLNRGNGFVVKKLTIFPGKNLSTHLHHKRSEHWSIVSGVATITIDQETRNYERNQSIFVPVEAVHTVKNESAKELVMIEVSVGESAQAYEKDLVFVEEVEKPIPDMIELEPVYKDYLWGGNHLSELFGKKSTLTCIAESWELSLHPDGETEIVGGFSEKTLKQLLQKAGKKVLGWKCQPFEEFPILVKFLDAKEELSIQVHPDDNYALREEHEYGKNEMWYILEALEGAYVYHGFREEITPDECLERMKNGTIHEVLNKVYVKKGDVIFVDAKTVHAVGAGIVLLEIQQSSNATYRMYDYDRLTDSGEKRQLHWEKALANIEFAKTTPVSNAPIFKVLEKGYRLYELGECKYFSVSLYEIDEFAQINLNDTSFSAITVIAGEGTFQIAGQQMNVTKGKSYFVTAGNKVLEITGNCQLILTKI